MQLWQRQKRTGLARWRRKSPATVLLALLLTFAQVQFALAAIVNDVVATGTFLGSNYTATATESVVLEPSAPALDVIKVGILNDDDGTPGVSAGDSISYEITARNTGNTTLTNVSASDPLLPGAALVFDAASDTDNDSQLDVGEIWRWTGSYVLDQVIDVDTNGGGDGDVDNTVTITADELPAPVVVSEQVPLTQTPEMTLAKTGVYHDDDGIPGMSAGDSVDYTVTVRNTGNVTINVTAIADPMVTLVWNGVDAGGDGVLSPGEIWSYSGSYVLQQSDFDTNGGGDGLLDNTVTVSTDELPDQTATYSLPLGGNPGISLGKLADISGVTAAGDLVNYTVTATNSGNTTLTNVIVSDPKVTPSSIACPLVTPGSTCTLNGTYAVTLADLTNGTVQNTANVSTNEGETDTVAVDTPLTATPRIDVSKSASPSIVNAVGVPINYTVTVFNTGNVPLSGVVVSDPMVALDCGAGSSTIVTLLPGTPQVCSGTYLSTQANIDSGTPLLNTVTVRDDGTYNVSDTARATVNFIQSPAMTVSKSGTLNDNDGVGGVSAGDSIAYSVVVTNTGNMSLTNIAPNDPLVTLVLASGDLDNDNELDPAEVWTFAGDYLLTQADVDSDGGGNGIIENTVSVGSDQLPGVNTGTDVPLNIAPSMELAKDAVLNDDDGNAGLTAGDTITYTVTVTNTGNVRLTNVAVNDPMLTLTGPAGDANGDNRLDVNEIWTFTGTTIVTQADLDTLGGGDGDIDNTATVSTDQLPDQDVSHELPIAPISSIVIEKTASAPVQLFPTIFEFDYVITLRNAGAITQTNIRLEDDIAAAISPASLMGTPVVALSGFSGTGGINGGYNGSTDIGLLVGDVRLDPGATGEVTISIRIDTNAQTVNGLNTAYVDSDQVTTPIPSNDPNRTPGDINDIQPTLLGLPDTDGDGSPDADETTGDREGDGVANSADYDPTGYFYCQADGRILAGGAIRVENLTSGGSVSGVGSGSGITILRDGTDGRYQFHVNQAGTYRLSFDALPSAGVLSTSLVSSGTLDVGSTPDNPRVIGSGEFASTGILADFTPTANPYYTLFEIAEGDPAVFNNNIPMQFCGSPLISVEKSVEAGPTLQPDLSSEVTYRLNVEASGNEQVANVQLLDNLDAVFGAGNYTIINTVLDNGPAGFAVDPFFNGSSNTALLTAGNSLQPGETASVLLTINVRVANGIFSNVVTGTGASPLDNSPVPTATDNADITINVPTDQILVEKTALPSSAPIGAPVVYTIKVSNKLLADLTNVEVIDLIPNGMTFVANSAKIEGINVVPTNDPAKVSGRELIFAPVAIPAGGSITITLTMIINASASAPEFINNAFVRDSFTGNIISNVAKAVVKLMIEPVFQCSDIIGRVFDDLNKNGYADDGEPGLPGVRLATARGLLIVTDKFGRYSIACGAIPDEDIGSNFILKLDTRTLPTGYRVTSENPRVVRLTRGKMTKLNFAAANLRVVRLELSDASFKSGETRLTAETLQTLGGLLALLDEEPSVLKITYNKRGETTDLGKARTSSVEALLKSAWDQKRRRNKLTVEAKLID